MNQPPHSHAYPSIGEVIDGKYQIERMLGEGGMGAVAKAMHLLRRAPVALKFMSPGVITFPGAVERFLNEGVAASQIDSDHVVHIFDVGKLPSGSPYLVMEYMEGFDLAELLAREGRPGLDPYRAVHFTVQTLRGLQVAHDAGIIHRDMKPSNCFVVHKEGEDDWVKLLDFGISKVQQGRSASLTQTNSALGTPLYMSPEQAKSPRDVDLRSDLYSVAVILYELLSGRTPFISESGEFTEILFKLFTADPPPIRSLRPEIPEGFAAVIHKGLAREPRDRFVNAAEFGAALEPWSDARSARVIHRLKTHAPGRKSAYPPGMSGQPAQAAPAVAFSQLASGKSQLASQGHGPSAPGQVVARATTPQPASNTPSPGEGPRHHSAFPPALDNRAASAAEAVAATQFSNTPSVLPGAPPLRPSNAPGYSSNAPHGGHPAHQAIPGAPLVPGAAQAAAARTDLGAARDTSFATPAPGRKMSTLAIAIPSVVIMGLVGAGVWKLTQPRAPASSGIVTDPEKTAAPAIPPPAIPVITASAPSIVPSASASIAPSATAPPPPPSAKPHAPATSVPTSTGRQPIRLKDLKPVE